ncbi:hypothetical protein Tco_0602465 [Tanacetum coccineum]
MDNEISFPSVPRCRLIEGFQVRRIYVEGGSSSEVMYEHCFRNLGSDTKSKTEGVKGVVCRVLWRVVKCHSLYNVMLGRTGMRSLGAVASKIHAMIKFPTANGIATMVTKGETLQECRRIEEAEGPTQEGRVKRPEEAEPPQPPEVEITTNEKDEEDRLSETPEDCKPPEKGRADKGPTQTRRCLCMGSNRYEGDTPLCCGT